MMDKLSAALADHPIIERDGRVFIFPNEGSRDALCFLIGSTVLEVVTSEKEIALMTSVGAVRIPINTEGRESAHFVIGDGAPVEVW